MDERAGPSWPTVALLGAVAYFWPLADDAPVNLDALLNAHSWGHVILEILFKALMLAFALLAVREATIGSALSARRKGGVWLMLVVALVLANLDDFALVLGPLHFMRQEELWDPANASTKAVSVVVFCLTLLWASSPRRESLKRAPGVASSVGFGRRVAALRGGSEAAPKRSEGVRVRARLTRGLSPWRPPRCRTTFSPQGGGPGRLHRGP